MTDKRFFAKLYNTEGDERDWSTLVGDGEDAEADAREQVKQFLRKLHLGQYFKVSAAAECRSTD